MGDEGDRVRSHCLQKSIGVVMKEWIVACVIFAFAAVWVVMGIVSLCQKGFLFNNAYIWASQKEREKMDKKPYYKQTGVVFILIGVMFVLFGLDVLFKTGLIWLVGILFGLLIGVYAIISTIRIEKRKKK